MVTATPPFMLAFLFLAALTPASSFDLATHERPRVLRLADAALDAEVRTITSVVNPRSAGGPHDFSSDGDYWWPDPATPSGPYIARDGLSNPDNFVAHRELMMTMAGHVGALATAYRLTGEERYAAAAVRHLHAWFAAPETRMNPFLLYAQAVRGRSTGRRIGLIDTLHLVEPALAVLALRGSASLTPETDAAITDWFRRYGEWLRTHPFGIEESQSRTNHSTCWTLQVACFARVSGDESALAECRRRFREMHLGTQMALDGSFPEELLRTKPYGYSLFHLDVLAGLAVVLSTPDEDLVRYRRPDGRGVLPGIAWLAPFVADKNAWLASVHRYVPSPTGPVRSEAFVRPDVLYWSDWPVRQPFLLFGALATGRQDWLELWQRLDADPSDPEIVRNFPIRQPLLWHPAP